MEHRVVFVHRILVNLEKTLSAPVLCCHVLCGVAQLALELFIKRCWMAKDSGLWQGEQCVQRHGERSDHDGEQRHSGQSFRQDQEGCWNHGLSRISPAHSSIGGPVAVVCMRTASGVRAGVARLAYANSYHFCRQCCQRIIWQLEEKQSSFLPMLKLLAAVAGAGVVCAGAAQAIPERTTGVDLVDAFLRLPQMPTYAIIGGVDPAITVARYGESAQQACRYLFNGKVDLSDKQVQQFTDTLRDHQVRMLFLALGVPKQDCLALKIRPLMPELMITGIGGTFEILGPNGSRARKWMQKLGMEWLFRLFKEPDRLWKRYLIHYPAGVKLLLKDMLHARPASKSG